MESCSPTFVIERHGRTGTFDHSAAQRDKQRLNLRPLNVSVDWLGPDSFIIKLDFNGGEELNFAYA